MKIKLTTLVDSPFEKVWKNFNRDLFEKLTPPGAQVNIVRFDGCRTGDQFQLSFSILGKKCEWQGKITHHRETDTECFFIDEGVVLPPPLTFWKHKHRIVKSGYNKAFIIDEIEFSCDSKLKEFILYPVLMVTFSLRKISYKKIFKEGER